MSDCSLHKKEVAGISDMYDLADLVADLHYESLWGFMAALSDRLYLDGLLDMSEGRMKLGQELMAGSKGATDAAQHIKNAWEISKPFMPNNEPDVQGSDTTMLPKD